ncbi:MAG: ABC transporter substrate-binding protein [Lachnospiraceae bacterium]|nr:ABC transporter substrate-binding protein [Lachnospiraceae bacterium]
MLASVLAGCKGKADNSLTVFNYGMYIEPEVLEIFEEETGIKIKYEEAPTPEELYTKYKSGAIQYDVLCTSEYMLQRLINEGELKEVDFSTMEHTSGIGEDYWKMCRDFDESNKYVMPYFWGTVGILYDSQKVKGDIDSWEVLFNGEYAGDFIMQNSMRDAYMVALKYLGYSMNTTDEKELNEAQELLLKQKDDVQSYLVDEVRDEVIAGNATMGVVYSGEAFYAYEENDALLYSVPKEGSNLWIDCWGITKECKNEENAKKFLDFLCREDIARLNFEYVRYSSPITAIEQNLTDAEKASQAVNPSKDVIESCEIYKQLPDETTDLMNTLWKELKAE